MRRARSRPARSTLRLAPRPSLDPARDRLAVDSLRIPPHGLCPWGSTSRPRVTREVSAGGVILRSSRGSPRVCVIARRRDDRLVWGLPKGHLEAGERPREAAIREVREETGLVGDVVEKLGVITYWFSGPEPHTRHFKTVHFYWLRYVSGRTSAHDDEVEDAVWLPLEEAIGRVAYANEKRILRKVRAKLRGNAASA